MKRALFWGHSALAIFSWGFMFSVLIALMTDAGSKAALAIYIGLMAGHVILGLKAVKTSRQEEVEIRESETLRFIGGTTARKGTWA